MAAVLAIRGRRAGIVWAAVLGALCIIGAGFNGASFLNYNKDANSYVMALLFAAAVLCYSVILGFHAGLGLLLVLGSLWLVVVAIRGRRAGYVWTAVLGALFILGAGFNGASFLNYNKDANSFVMALLFAAAVLCYIVILALPRSTQRQAPPARRIP